MPREDSMEEATTKSGILKAVAEWDLLLLISKQLHARQHAEFVLRFHQTGW